MGAMTRVSFGAFRVIKNSRGTILLMSYFVMAVMAIFSLALFVRSHVFLQSTERHQNRMVAFNMAEAGLATALKALETNLAYAGTAGFTSLSTQTVKGGFEVEVSEVTGRSDVRLIEATGYAPDDGEDSRAAERRAVLGYAQIQQPSLFNYAVLAKNSITINGVPTVDSYDSRNGAYGGSNRGSEAHIATNGTANSSINVIGTSTVNGSASVGPQANTATAISVTGGSSITGTKSALAEAVDVPTETTSVSSSGALTVGQNQTTTLSAGTYHYSSLTISGNGARAGRLDVTGPVKIYVSGSVDIAGSGIVSANNLPSNVVIYVTQASNVSIRGTSNFYGGVYAPLSDVNVSGTPSFFGAVVANNYTQQGTGQLHFDKAMTQFTGSGRAEVNVLSWWEDHTVAGG